MTPTTMTHAFSPHAGGEGQFLGEPAHAGVLSSRLISLALLLFLAGCGSSSNNSKQDDDPHSQFVGSPPAIEVTLTESRIIEGRIALDELPAEVLNRIGEPDFLDGLLIVSHLVYGDEVDCGKGPVAQITFQKVFAETEVTDDSIIIRSAQPVLSGEEYSVEVHPDRVGLKWDWFVPASARLIVPEVDRASIPEVLSVYPTTTEVPANHLKFYVHFSEPMQQGGIFDFIRLRNLTTGEVVPRPFRHTELWSKDDRRLTLWFHPGRQKTGVNLNVEIGPVLQAGHDYELQFSGDRWPARNGGLLSTTEAWLRVCRFKAVEADHAQPETKNWRLSLPQAGTTEPLVCEFDESLDWALIRSQIRVMKKGDEPFDCKTVVTDGERTVRFVPWKAWAPGEYHLAIGTVLEDLAGNSLERPFEVDLSKPVTEAVATEFRRLPFRIARPAEQNQP